MGQRQLRFRWEFVGVLLALLIAAWCVKGARVAFEWQDVMQWLGVQDSERYTRLCVLGLLLIGVVAVLRIARTNGKT